jgi:hypothetical protein
MRLRFHTFRAVVATGISLWMAVLACLLGCTVPILASSGKSRVPSMHDNSADQNQPDLMADMENCPHHSGGNTPAKQHDPKPVRGAGTSCCPAEVTLASKPNTVTMHSAPASVFVLSSNFTLTTIRIVHSVEFDPPLWHSGRDTLLDTRLLRI